MFPDGRVVILCIDDEPLILAVMNRVFRGHTVVGHRDGCAAIAHLMGEPRPDYDVIMCDMLMPECSGVDVYRALKRDRPDLLARMVFFTGVTGMPVIESFLKESGRPVLMKPFGMGELQSVVQSVVGSP